MRAVTSSLLILLAAAVPTWGQDLPRASDLEARVWLDRGDEPVLQRGDDVRVYYRTSADLYTAIFRIDTDGHVSLLHPAHPQADHLTRARRDYRLLFPRAAQWEVRDDPGVGYFFIVAAPQPLDLSAFRFVASRQLWDLGSVGTRVYEDPYLAIDDFVAALIPNWDVAEYTLDFIRYDVGEQHSYPRFLCYDCHESRSYASWNPYTYACTSFRIVIWDDPYFYPAYRYSGARVVFTVPQRNRPRYTVAVRAPGEGWSPIVRRRSTPPALSRPTQYKEPTAARGGGRATPERRATPASTPSRATTTRAAPSRTTPASAAPTRSAKPRGGVSPSAPARAGSSTTGRPSAAPARPAATPARPSATPSRPSVTPRPTLIRRPSTTIRRGGNGGGVTSSRQAAPRSRFSRDRATSARSSNAIVVPSGTVRPGRTTVRPSARSNPLSRSRPVSRFSPASGSSRARPSRPVSGAGRVSPSRPVSRSRPVSSSRPTGGRASSARTPVRSRPITTRAPTRAAPVRAKPRAKPRPPPRRRPGG